MTDSANRSDKLALLMEEYAVTWMSSPGVEGVGVGEDCLKVYFASEEAIKSSDIPDQINGIEIVKIVSGEFEALGK